jgi:N utilization substance protein B
MTASKSSGTARRRAARLAAVQALYQIALTGARVKAVMAEFVRFRFGKEQDGDMFVEPDRMLFADIVQGVAETPQDLDDLVRGALAQGWELERLELLLRMILRAGAWELRDNREVPVRIVIAEYIELAHAFFAGPEKGMVNAVLDRLAHLLRADELAAAPEGER